jgi:hypothetical protein
MKHHSVAALALVLLASCGPDLAAIDHATREAEDAAARAENAATRAEGSATQASEAAARANRRVSDADDSVRRANDIASRFCAAKGIQEWRMPSYLNTPEYRRRLKLFADACAGK